MKRSKKALIVLLLSACCALAIAAFVLFDGEQGEQKDKKIALQEYQADVAQIASLRQSLQPGPTNDLDTYERFAEGMINKWSQGSKEYYARMINELCAPLSSGRFDEARQHIVAREYAMLALTEANDILLETELELTGHVVTYMGRLRPQDAQWVRIRREDVQVRLHAWGRLLDAIDPNWDPNDPNNQFVRNVAPPRNTRMPAGVTPEAIKDPILRGEYEAAIEKNKQKLEEWNKQYRARMWLDGFPETTEQYIVAAYSTPPYDTDELKQLLERYSVEEQTSLKIIDAVTRNIEQQTK